MSNPATMQDVADKAGVHRSTVSLALRNSQRISTEVREHIQKIAVELGYRPNPLVTALMRSRRSKKETGHETLAYVTNYSTRYGWRPEHHNRPNYFEGASQRAGELGFKLEHFWLREKGMTPDRFAQILLNRGINGILIGRLPPGISNIDVPLQHFSCVALGMSLRTPRLHRVSEDMFTSAALAMRSCIADGYQRIGLALTEPDNDSPGTGDRYLGAYLRYQLKLDPENRIPHFKHSTGSEFGVHFLDWIHTCEPDLVLASHAEPILELYRKARREFPSSFRLALLVNDRLLQSFPSIHLDASSLGALAVDMVVGMLHRGETGIPKVPHHILIPGEWVEGDAMISSLSLAAGQKNGP